MAFQGLTTENQSKIRATEGLQIQFKTIIFEPPSALLSKSINFYAAKLVLSTILLTFLSSLSSKVFYGLLNFQWHACFILAYSNLQKILLWGQNIYLATDINYAG